MPASDEPSPGPTPTTTPRGQPTRTWPIALAGVALVVPSLVRFLARDYTEFLIFNADLLMIPAVLDDLARGGGLSDWHLPSAPYFVPDVPVYLAARVMPNYFLDAAAFAVLQLAITWFAWWWLCRVLVPGARSDRAALAGFAWFVLFVSVQSRPFGYGLASYVHFGTFTLTILGLGASVRAVRDRSGRWLIAFGVIAVAATISDRWFVVWLLAPAAVGLLSWAGSDRGRLLDVARWAAVGAVAVVIATVVHAAVLVHDNPADASVEFRGLGHVADVMDVVVDEARVAPVTAGVTASAWIGALIVLGAAARYRRRAVHRRAAFATPGLDADDARVMFGVLAATAPAVVAAQLAMSTTPDIRYFGPAYGWPVLVGGLLVGLRGGRIGTIAMVVPVAIAAIPALAVIGDVTTTRTDDVACIDDALEASGSRRGISTYWDAKPITVASRLELVIATVSPDLAIDPVNSSAAHYGEPYDFAVLSTWADPYTLEDAGVVPRAGDPVTTTACGIYTVLDYGPAGLSWTDSG